jgi:hypothetical protein
MRRPDARLRSGPPAQRPHAGYPNIMRRSRAICFGAAQRTRLDERALIVRRPHESIDQFRVRHSLPPVPRQLDLVLVVSKARSRVGLCINRRGSQKCRDAHRTQPFYLISRARFSMSAGNVNRGSCLIPSSRTHEPLLHRGSQAWCTRDQLGPYAFVYAETMTCLPMMLRIVVVALNCIATRILLPAVACGSRAELTGC